MIVGKPIDNSQYTFDPLNPALKIVIHVSNNTMIYDGALVLLTIPGATTVVNT